MKWFLMICALMVAVSAGCDGSGQGLTPLHSMELSRASHASWTYRPPLPGSPYLRGPGERVAAVSQPEPRALEETGVVDDPVLDRSSLVNNRPPKVNLSVASR
jgi:hypothetical protein